MTYIERDGRILLSWKTIHYSRSLRQWVLSYITTRIGGLLAPIKGKWLKSYFPSYVSFEVWCNTQIDLLEFKHFFLLIQRCKRCPIVEAFKPWNMKANTLHKWQLPNFSFIWRQKLQSYLAAMIQVLWSFTGPGGRFFIDFLAWISSNICCILPASSYNFANRIESCSSFHVITRWSLRALCRR